MTVRCKLFYKYIQEYFQNNNLTDKILTVFLFLLFFAFSPKKVLLEENI